MNKQIINCVFILTILITGCADTAALPELMPPLFSKGDIVKVTSSVPKELGTVTQSNASVGYITDMHLSNNSWRYTIMFQQTTMFCDESVILLVKRAMWYEDENLKTLAESNELNDFKILEGKK